MLVFFFFSSRRRHTRFDCDWSSDVCSSDLGGYEASVMHKGAYLLGKLMGLQARHPEIGEVDGLGLALRMEMCEADGFTPSRRLADRMFQIGLEGDLSIGGRTMGLVLDIGGYYKNVITLAPSREITTAEMDLGAALLDQVMARAKAQLR